MDGEVALNDSEQTEAALDGISRMSPMLCRYGEIELIYLQNRETTKVIQEFESCLVDLYIVILEYQVAAACRCKEGSFSKSTEPNACRPDWLTMLLSSSRAIRRCNN